MKIPIIICLILVASHAQPCLDPNGNAVSWWINLIFPGSVPGGFAYFDSTFTSPEFTIYSNPPDSSTAPLTRTLTQINELKLQSVAWNDETPAGKTSSYRAHSKTVIAYNS